jgi:hypothetical protein
MLRASKPWVPWRAQQVENYASLGARLTGSLALQSQIDI